jgi:tRNA threonylcarbamoyladenosine biosynthesis protein TsaB
MIVLAIDTSHEFGSLGLASDEGTMEEVLLHEPGGFSGTLFDQIGSLLKRHRLLPDQIDLLAAAAGPGSFTGVRIGLTAAKALAEAHGKPCFGVSNLEAMARAGTDLNRTDLNRAVLLDARRGEVYGAVFGSDPEEEVVRAFSTWVGTLSDVQEFLAFDFTPFEAALAQSRFSGALRTRVPRAIAGAIAAIALERYRAGEPGDAATLDANNVRRSDAELLWKDRL